MDEGPLQTLPTLRCEVCGEAAAWQVYRPGLSADGHVVEVNPPLTTVCDEHLSPEGREAIYEVPSLP